jgi:predicted DNA-binding antitoxin AbrB/MazE fold protein
MFLEVEATYEDGVLKLDQPLPLQKNDRVVVSIKPLVSRVEQTFGIVRWTGNLEGLEYLARDPENSVWEQD